MCSHPCNDAPRACTACASRPTALRTLKAQVRLDLERDAAIAHARGEVVELVHAQRHAPVRHRHGVAVHCGRQPAPSHGCYAIGGSRALARFSDRVRACASWHRSACDSLVHARAGLHSRAGTESPPRPRRPIALGQVSAGTEQAYSAAGSNTT